MFLAVDGSAEHTLRSTKWMVKFVICLTFMNFSVLQSVQQYPSLSEQPGDTGAAGLLESLCYMSLSESLSSHKTTQVL